MMIRKGLCTLAAFALLAGAPISPLEWAFPGLGSKVASIPGTRIYRLPGAFKTFTEAAINDMTHAPDWFPNEHPPAPHVILAGAPCGYAIWSPVLGGARMPSFAANQ